MTRFELGRTTATPGALAALGRAGLDPACLFLRHAFNDWGDLCEADRRANERALADGGRLLSAYALPGGGKVWLITDAADDDGSRASTCLLLPSEY